VCQTIFPTRKEPGYLADPFGNTQQRQAADPGPGAATLFNCP
jgi:hypothetical protein